MWRRHLNSTTMLLADGNLNGIVDTADYAIWEAHFGLTVPLPPFGAGGGSRSARSAAVAGIVPEPTGSAFVLTSLSGWFFISTWRARIRKV
jgi:hypothetical protein